MIRGRLKNAKKVERNKKVLCEHDGTFIMFALAA